MIEIDISKRMYSQEGPLDLRVKTAIRRHDFVTVSGKSGSGKTTLLRMLAGLVRPDSGRITCGGKVWFDSNKKIHIRPQKRKTGFVFQDATLFPNMTAKENILYACNDHKTADELLEMMELENLKNRYAENLSGGQKQRVALARALASGPDLLLLDEPFAHLDCVFKVKLLAELVKIHSLFRITVVLVTHDTAEIRGFAERNLTIEKGRISVQANRIQKTERVFV
jgi:molybdate transport system ATP-binding protein